MEIEVRDRIIMMLKSGDSEMRDLAVLLFCQQRATFMEYFYIERRLKYGEYYYDNEIKRYLAKMSKCTK